MPGHPPKEYMCKPRWGFVPKNLDAFPQEEIPSPEPAPKKLFEKLPLEKIKGPADRVLATRHQRFKKDT